MTRTCDCSDCSKIRRNIADIFSALKIYGWMLDSYIVDFYLEDHWSKLPSSWKTLLDQIQPDELGKWILRQTNGRYIELFPIRKARVSQIRYQLIFSHQVYPLSLIALRSFIEKVEICRDQERKDASFKCVSRTEVEIRAEHDRTDDVPRNNKLLNDEKLDKLIMKHVKEKKRYEIPVMSEVVADCASKAKCKCVVDIGSGIGHLARALAYKYGLCLLCVEQNPDLIERARKWDDQLELTLRKRGNDLSETRSPHHASMWVSVKKSCELDQTLRANFDLEGSDELGYGLIGLHPCGDLGPTLLKLYATEPRNRFICVVGCCYMKLSQGGSAEAGYPMSEFLKRLPASETVEMSYNALEVSCHASENHCDKLVRNDYDDLIVHAYRAALEYLLAEKSPQLRRCQVKSLKSHGLTFQQYCQAATADLHESHRPSEDDCQRSDVLDMLLDWKRVLAFGSMRLMLAPLVESLLLYDRFLYLSELGFEPELKARFDPRLSPRNVLLTSIKS
ncbi:unnamed protein product [Trichogramma brassicae]|uniref:Methyltransferase domain-containing protein n=1 Tax=Trichogramma brassicae TaxID=86971 RepID=A0A6H5J8H7_9HYME|nr:unnamed protein product [Trichogramma brassicae]